MTATAIRLLDAVDAVIEQHGPSGVTLRRVGECAGLSHTAAAHYYNDKPGLFTAYITRAWNQVGDDVERAAQINSPREALIQAARSYAEFAIRSRSAFTVMSRLELADADDQDLWRARERGFFALADVVQRGQAAGWATSVDPLDLLATLWGLVHGVTDLWVGGPLQAPYDGHELSETVERLLVGVLDSLDPIDRDRHKRKSTRTTE